MCDQTYALTMITIGVDELCCIVTHLVNACRLNKRVNVNNIYARLCLFKDATYLRHVRQEMQRLYFSVHWAWHRYELDFHWHKLNAWYIKDYHFFDHENCERCSVVFNNGTDSCMLGFLVLQRPPSWRLRVEQGRGLALSYFKVVSRRGIIVFPEVDSNDIICPVFI